MADKEEDSKQSIGMAGMGISAVAGVGAGAVATNAVVSSRVKSNLLAPYLEGTKKYFAEVNYDLASHSSANGAGEIIGAAGFVKNSARHDVHDEFQQSGSAIAKDLANPDTLLGKAKERALTKQAQLRNTKPAELAMRHFDELAQKSDQMGNLSGIEREAAAKELLKLIENQSHEIDAMHVAQKVKEIPWAKRLNPFNKELHLAGSQKTIAVAAGAAVALGAAFGVSKLIGWMSKGSDSEVSR